MSQFAFLRHEWPVVHEAVRAEASARPDPRTSCFDARRALEVLVQWVYKHDAAIQLLASLPTGPRQRRKCLFQLARRLKELPKFAYAKAEDLEGIVRKWFRLALPVIRTKTWKTSWTDLVNAWNDVPYPMGAHIAADVMEAAVTGELPESAAGFTDVPTRKLLALCRAMDEQAQHGTFFLSYRLAEKLCGFTGHMTASRRLKKFVKVGILDLVDERTKGTQVLPISFRSLAKSAGPRSLTTRPFPRTLTRRLQTSPYSANMRSLNSPWLRCSSFAVRNLAVNR